MELASPADRLKAFLVDSFIGGLLYALFMQRASTLLRIAGGLGFAAFVIYQWMLLSNDGQTIGKRAFGLRIVRVATEMNGGFVTNIILRSWVNGLLCFIPLYFLVDSLFVFRQDRRCVHDFLAGTKVVKA